MNNKTASPHSRRLKAFSVIVLALMMLSFGLRIGARQWLWGWQDKALSFHESWSETQREQLEEWAEFVRHGYILSYRPKTDENLYSPTLGELALEEEGPFAERVQHAFSFLMLHLRASAAMRSELVELYDMLRQVAATGRGDIYTSEGFSAAHMAARFSRLDLLCELVRRGAQPNRSGSYPESVFQAAIACIPFPYAENSRAGQPERLRTLDRLLSLGADIRADAGHTLLLANLADMMDQTEEEEDSTPGATLEWLLDHGLRAESKEERVRLCHFMEMRGSLPTMQRLLKKGYLSAQDAPALLTAAASCTEEDAAAKARWALALGADPNIGIPACLANLQIYDDTTDEGDMAAFNAVLELLDVLLEHGAALPSTELCLPKDEPQKSLYLELLEKHARLRNARE